MIPGVLLLELAVFEHDMSTTFKGILLTSANITVLCHLLPLHVGLSFTLAKKANTVSGHVKKGPTEAKSI